MNSDTVSETNKAKREAMSFIALGNGSGLPKLGGEAIDHIAIPVLVAIIFRLSFGRSRRQGHGLRFFAGAFNQRVGIIGFWLRPALTRQSQSVAVGTPVT